MRQSIALAASALLWLTSSSFAQQTGKDALDQWIQNYAALGLDVSYGYAANDGDALKVTDLTYRYSTLIDFGKVPEALGDKSAAEPQKIAINFSAAAPDVRIEGIQADADGFSAKLWSFTDTMEWTASLVINDDDPIGLTGEIEDYIIKDLFEPRFEASETKSSDPFGEWRPVIKFLLGIRYAETTISRLTYEPSAASGPEAEQFVGTFEAIDYVAKDFANGRMAEFSQGATRQVTPTEMPDGSIVDTLVTTASSKTIGLDVKPFLALLDPEPVGELTNYDMIETSNVSDYRVTLGEIKATIDSLSASGISVRAKGEGLLPLLQTAMSGAEIDPVKGVAEFVGVYRSFGVDEMSVDQIAIETPNPDNPSQLIKGTIGQVLMEDFSSDGLGNFATSAIDFSDGDEIQFKLGKFSIGDIEFAPYGPIKAFIEKAVEADPGFEPEPIELARIFTPRSIAMELTSLLVKGPFDETDPLQILELGVANVHVNMATDVPPVPTKVEIKAEGVAMPIALTDEPVRSVLAAAGIVNMLYSSELNASWDEATEDFSINRLSTEIGDFLSINGTASVGGVAMHILENPEQAQAALAGLTLKEVDFGLDNAGGVQAILQVQAEAAGIDEAEFKSGLVQQLTAALAIVSNDAFATMVTEAASAFLDSPQTLDISIMPERAIPVAQIIGTAAVAPQSLPDLLGISVTANQ